ncbi:unnamed protein product [Didymodactylos carnosus]|uniref:Uncharacterized protein n=1 Tax=Didymodactylos carnosus TaxID=1234261 RepID=A0A8S2HBA2_9BILA|nr:unnamed protein product [Didymodactylos carnosus]CAF3619240.1 unnamed protein product [Didymodactylos carnosus]
MKLENQPDNVATMTQNGYTRDQYTTSTLTPTNSAGNLNLMPKRYTSSTKLSRQTSLANRNNYYPHSIQNSNTSNEFLIHHTSTRGVPIVASAISKFFEATKIMEDEVMLPSKLKDTTVEENMFDSGIQPNNWHEVFKFAQDIRNQLQCSRPFSDNYEYNHINNHSDNYATPSLITESETGNSTNYSSASSTTSDLSSEGDNNHTTANISSFEAIKDELKFHYYGLTDTLDNLTWMVNRVTEKYREDVAFKLG